MYDWLKNLSTLQKVGLGAGVLVVGRGVYRKRQGKAFFGLGDAQVYEGGYSVKSSDFNRRGQVRGNWRLNGLSGHQARFGAVASSCGGRGYNPKQFRSCMSRGLR